MQLSDLDRVVTPRRVRDYSLLLVTGYLLGAIIWLATMTHGVDRLHKPLGYDFITFYAASEMARAGHAAAAFDIAQIAAVERAIVPASSNVFLWHYPPTFQVLIAPLAYVPYGVSLALFLGSTFALYLALARRISNHPWAPLVAAAFPAVFINGMHGQNGFLTASLLGFGLLLLDRRPWIAGLCLGLLVYKPHLGVLLPLLLLVQGRWRAIAGAALSGSALCAASVALYGLAPWSAFIANTKLVSYVLESRSLPWAKIPSVFVAAADLGLPLPAAYGVHAAVAITLAALTLYAWRRPGPQTLKVALAIPAILAVSPYCFDYDLVLLAIPIGLLAEHARRHGFAPGTLAALVLAFATPIVFTPIAERTGLHLMPLGILVLFAAVWVALRRPVLAVSAVDEPFAAEARPA